MDACGNLLGAFQLIWGVLGMRMMLGSPRSSPWWFLQDHLWAGASAGKGKSQEIGSCPRASGKMVPNRSFVSQNEYQAEAVERSLCWDREHQDK